MRPLANKPYCVWFNAGHVRTFATLRAAQRFAARVGGRIGHRGTGTQSWIELPESFLQAVRA